MDYVIATVPRTGSTMLCALLRHNGVGEPAEHLNPDPEASDFAHAVAGGVPVEQYLASARAGSVGRGMPFGTKLMHHWMPEIRNALRRPSETNVEMLTRLFPEARYVRLRRRDMVAAAVSHTLAISSGCWQDPAPGGLEIAADAVYPNHVWLDRCEIEWTTTIAALEVPVLTIYYEDLVERTAETLTAVGSHLGVALQEPLVLHSETQILRNDVSRAVRSQYSAWLERNGLTGSLG